MTALRGLKTYRLGTGDARTFLKLLPAKSVHSIVTSPPYYNLRSYHTEPQFWGGDDTCAHTLDQETSICTKCGTWRGELGHEPDPDLFVQHLVEIFRAAHRVLRDDGTLFINIGDSHVHGNRTTKLDRSKSPPEKNMFAVPWRLGLALQADNWILRQAVIWAKSGGNCPRCHYRLEKGSAMPQPVHDRFVSAHEYVLIAVKKPKYFFDYVAVQQDGANRRDVLFLTATPFRHHAASEDSGNQKRHFAVMSEHLAEVCVLAGTPEKTCGACGAPWVRVLKSRKESKAERLQRVTAVMELADVAPRHDGGALQHGIHIGTFEKETLGWRPTCKCDADVLPGVVLDMFSGAGTTGAVGIRLGRRYFGIDIDPEIKPVAEARIEAELLARQSNSVTEWLTDDAGNCLAQ